MPGLKTRQSLAYRLAILTLLLLGLQVESVQACSPGPEISERIQETMIKCSPKLAWCLKVSYGSRTPGTEESRRIDLIGLPTSVYRFETLFRLERVGLFDYKYLPHRRKVSLAYGSVWEGERWLSDTGWLASLELDAKGNDVLDVFDPEGGRVQRIVSAMFVDSQNQSAVIEENVCSGRKRWIPQFYPIEPVRFLGDRLVIKVNSALAQEDAQFLYKEIHMSLSTGKILTDWEAADEKNLRSLPGHMLMVWTMAVADQSSVLGKYLLYPFATLVDSLPQIALSWQHFRTHYSLLNEETVTQASR